MPLLVKGNHSKNPVKSKRKSSSHEGYRTLLYCLPLERGLIHYEKITSSKMVRCKNIKISLERKTYMSLIVAMTGKARYAVMP